MVGQLDAAQASELVDVVLLDGAELEDERRCLGDPFAMGVGFGQWVVGQLASEQGEISEWAPEEAPGTEVSEGSSRDGDAEAISDEADDMAVVGGGVDPFDDQLLVFFRQGFEFGVGADFASGWDGARWSRERALALTWFRRRNHPLPLRRARGWHGRAGVGGCGLRDREVQI